MKKSIPPFSNRILAIGALTGCVCTKGEKLTIRKPKQGQLMPSQVSKDGAERLRLPSAQRQS